MRSRRSIPAVRDTSRSRGQQPREKTLCDDGLLWRISRYRAANAMRYRRPFRLTALLRAAGRQVLSLLGLM